METPYEEDSELRQETPISPNNQHNGEQELDDDDEDYDQDFSSPERNIEDMPQYDVEEQDDGDQAADDDNQDEYMQ